MGQIRWFRVTIVVLISLCLIGLVTFWEAKNNPLNNVDVDLALKGCAVNFSPDGSYEIIPFNDQKCPK
jgi:hypothetical protein